MKRLEDFKLEAFQQMWKEDPQKGFNVFAPLIHAESKWVFQTAYSILKNRADAEDVRNESFVKWIKALKDPQENDKNKLTRPYLSQIIKNTCHDLREKQNKEAEKRKKQAEQGWDNEPYDVYHDELHEHQLKQLHHGLQQLGEPCRSMLRLELETKLSQAEMLKKLNIEHAPTSVTGLFRNCKNRLRNIIFN